jgi:hypothetical protein
MSALGLGGRISYHCESMLPDRGTLAISPFLVALGHCQEGGF